MTPPGDVVARCQITLDGMMVFGEQSFTVGSWSWTFPLGLGAGGGMHFVGITVEFREGRR
jgi:tellurite resistance protein TehA-like permease